MSWFKNRSSTTWHLLYDAIRGTGSHLFPNEDDAPGSDAHITSFNDDGVTMQHVDSGTINASGSNYVGWFWDAGTAAATPSTAGDINPSDSWVNATAGFEIIKNTGNATNDQTIGHNLGAPPEFIMSKRISGSTEDWCVRHKDLTWDDVFLRLNTNAAKDTSRQTGSTAPTNTVFYVGSDGVNNDNATYIHYLWTAIPGYSAFGKYEGNGSTDGIFVYTGFRPRFILIKNADDTQNWHIHDTERNPSNVTNYYLFPNLDNGGYTNEGSNDDRRLDILSNGFKLRETAYINSAHTHIYAAFAEHPFKLARAR